MRFVALSTTSDATELPSHAMFLPFADENQGPMRPALVTWLLLAANGLVFLYQVAHPEFTYGYAAIPAEITSGSDIVEPVLLPVGPFQAITVPHAPGPHPIQWTLLTSMFMHAGFLHLAGNMLFLWIFGDNVERRFGHLPFLVFYVASGLAASLAQVAMDPQSVVPTLGASGAIAGVLGAYLVLFPYNRVYVIFFIYIISVPAFLVIVLWAITQFVNGFGAALVPHQTGGVAYAAHIAGFIMGVGVAFAYRLRIQQEPDSMLANAYARDPQSKRWW